MLLNIFPKYIKNYDFLNYMILNSKFQKIKIEPYNFNDYKIGIIKSLLNCSISGDLSKFKLLFNLFLDNDFYNGKYVILVEMLKKADTIKGY